MTLQKEKVIESQAFLVKIIPLLSVSIAKQNSGMNGNMYFVLFIDEISLLSLQILSEIDYSLRFAKNNQMNGLEV